MKITKLQKELFKMNERILYHIVCTNPIMTLTQNTCGGTLSCSTLDYADEQQKRFNKYTFHF